MSSPLNVLVVGGSRNIGYYASIRLLNQGSSVTFLMRSPSAFDNDATIQEHVKSGKARLVKGDAMNIEDVKVAWSEAGRDKPVDLLLSTVGFSGTPSFHPLKGFIISPADLVTKSLLNFLCTIPKEAPNPKVIVVTTAGSTKTSRKQTPLLLAPMYYYLLGPPLQDKLGAERVLAHCAGWDWNPADGEPTEDIIGKDWTKREGLPAPGSLKDVVVLRGAIYDGWRVSS
ncbi:hypothetical protein EST38_g13826 [Candolleomyces aberdarensis]|uniref:Uncharacterized protein n=1 Tax=Candolleomyces aberdarensis TaxID=2316362 RepID=A0A4Q2CZT9_9AGAR|nr:hypothetical protein EST38_g13826 [Candolleomyces aberdarensis]